MDIIKLGKKIEDKSGSPKTQPHVFNAEIQKIQLFPEISPAPRLIKTIY